MDATTHDAFLRRASTALRRRATPPAQRITRRTLPVVSRLLRTGQMAAARRTRPPVAPAQLPRAASERLRQQRLIRLSHHPDPRVREGARTELRRLGGGITSRQDPGLLARLPQAGRRGRIARQLRGRSGGGVEPPSEDEGPSEDEQRQEEHRQMLQEQWEDSVRQWTETMQEAAQQPDRLYAEERGDMIDDAVDTFADAAALLAESEDDLDLMIPVLAGLTARRAIHELVPPVQLRARQRTIQALGRSVIPAVTDIARDLTRRFGRGALRSIPRLVGMATDHVAQRRLPVGALPKEIRRLGPRLMSRPSLVRVLSRPAPVTRQVVQQALAGARSTMAMDGV